MFNKQHFTALLFGVVVDNYCSFVVIFLFLKCFLVTFGGLGADPVS